MLTFPPYIFQSRFIYGRDKAKQKLKISSKWKLADGKEVSLGFHYLLFQKLNLIKWLLHLKSGQTSFPS